ncbi:unnamed protein product [Soboliphyme baturini]|uniref:GOLD domain-containing protein n=1 Tax=Soboliphyme baturini TaxID=241478 RepID=A0A183IIE9_9BILA|nr:unnamed protein product [Soboliphyme baturini]
MHRSIICTFCTMLIVIRHVAGLGMTLKPNEKECLKDEMHKNEVVTGEYTFSAANGQKNEIIVSDTRGHILFKREDFTDEHGKFAFSADDYDVFEICVASRLPVGVHATNREVFLTLKHGVEAKNYEELAKVEKLKPLEMELKRLEDLTESIVQDFAYMRKREEEMRTTNESTNSRVLYLSVFSMMCLLSLATWQVLYLQRYFKAKKLID